MLTLDFFGVFVVLIVFYNIFFIGPAPSTPIPKDEKRDNDSDSGISVEISSNNAPSPPVIREPLTTKEQEALLPNYTAMVQEAILGIMNQN